MYYGEVGDIVFVNGNVLLREEIKDLELDGKLTVGEIKVDKLNGVKLGDLVDKSALEQEKNDRIAGDKELEEKINGESLIRQKADNELADKIGQEEAKRQAEVARLNGEVNRLDGRINNLEDRIDKVGAMSAAIANLRTMGYDPAAPTEIAVGIGQYRNETGMALGMFHYPNRDFMLSLSVSTSGDEVMGGIGATWKFGRKTPEQMLAAEKEKAAKAKLAKAEAMKKAAVEAKVAAQQAKHAKMAAEKAAK